MNLQDLGKELSSARNAKNWSQLELSKRSKVSNRTILELEGGEKTDIRADVLVRLAFVLSKDPQSWLMKAGKTMSNEQIHAITGPMDTVRFVGQVDPLDFFKQLKERLLTGSGSAFMCAVYPCVPGAIHRQDVQKYFIELLNSGKFRMAMICPFHRVGEISERKPHLAAFYRNVNDEVERLARELRNQVEDYRENLTMFIPASGGSAFLALPTPGLSEYRVGLIEYREADISYELVNWATLSHDGKDRILRVFPVDQGEHQDSALNSMLRWKDYLSDILTSRPTGKQKTGKASNSEPSPWEQII